MNEEMEAWLLRYAPQFREELRNAWNAAYADAARVCKQESAFMKNDEPYGALVADVCAAAILARASKPGG